MKVPIKRGGGGIMLENEFRAKVKRITVRNK